MPAYATPDEFAQACEAELRGLIPAAVSHNKNRAFVIGTTFGYQLTASADGWEVRLNGVVISHRVNQASPLSNFQAAVTYLNPRPAPPQPPAPTPSHALVPGALLHLAEHVTTAGGGMISTQELLDGTRITVLVLGKTVGRTPTPSEVDTMLATQVAAYTARTAP